MTTDFLFASHSFWRGVGRILDLGGTWLEFNRCDTPDQADAVAMYQDWRSVGEDIHFAAESSDSERRAVQGRLPL